MSEVTITVRGEQERRIAPEHAVVSVTVRADGPERGPVVERATALAEPLRDDLLAAQRSGEVVEWSSARVAVWSERPWNADGRQLPPVHHASIDVNATFRDFAALSWWLGETADVEEVQVSSIQWVLSPATRAEVEREVAAEAVAAAVERARAYATALGLDTVTPLELADVGLLANHAETSPMPKALRAMAMDAGGPALSLQPADIVVTAAVDARFAAS